MESKGIYNLSKFNNPKDKTKCDAIQRSLNSFITNNFLPWLMIVLVLNRKDWKRPVIIILILYWFLQSTGDYFYSFIYYKAYDENASDLDIKVSKYIYNAIAYVFWVVGEIVADWYPYLRTKALVRNKEKMKPVYSICVILNIIKVFQILINFIFIPLINKEDEEESKKFENMSQVFWWFIIFLVHLVIAIYDIIVILALKYTFSNKLSSYKYKVNSFLDRFKQISEYRFFISIIISITFFPCAIFQIIYFISKLKEEDLNNNFTDEIDKFRVVGLRYIYTFMYFDQILLRCYVLKNKEIEFSKSSIFNSIDSQHLIVSSRFPRFQPSKISHSPRSYSPISFGPSSVVSNTNMTSSKFSIYSNEPQSPYIYSTFNFNPPSISNSNANNSEQTLYNNEPETSFHSTSLLVHHNSTIKKT